MHFLFFLLPLTTALRNHTLDSLYPFTPTPPTSLSKLACDYNGCACDSRGKQLTVCGNCKWRDGSYAVTKKRIDTHIFECSPSGNCCSYGFATDCGGSNARCIIDGAPSC